MAPIIWHIAGMSLLAIGLIVSAWSLVLTGRARGRPRCPGALRPRWRRPLPRLAGCWYDLSGTTARADAHIVCPECGRLITRRRDLFRTRRRWGVGLVALAGAAAGVVTWLTPMLQASQWQSAAPTTLLLAFLDHRGLTAHDRAALELVSRQVKMWDWQQRWQARLFFRLAYEEDSRNSSQYLIFMQGLGVNARPVAPALAARLTDSGADDRDVYYIVRILGKARWRPGATAILAAVDRGDIMSYDQTTVAWALGACGDPSARDHLFKLAAAITDADWTRYSQRYEPSLSDAPRSVAGRSFDPLGAGLSAVVALARVGADDPEVVALLERIVTECDPAHTNVAAQASLSVLKGHQVDLPHAFAAYLAADQPLERRIEAVASMLGLHGDLAPVVPKIVQTVETTSDELLISVSCRALARAGAPGRKALKGLAKSDSDAVAKAAARALTEWPWEW